MIDEDNRAAFAAVARPAARGRARARRRARERGDGAVRGAPFSSFRADDAVDAGGFAFVHGHAARSDRHRGVVEPDPVRRTRGGDGAPAKSVGPRGARPGGSSRRGGRRARGRAKSRPASSSSPGRSIRNAAPRCLRVAMLPSDDPSRGHARRPPWSVSSSGVEAGDSVPRFVTRPRLPAPRAGPSKRPCCLRWPRCWRSRSPNVEWGAAPAPRRGPRAHCSTALRRVHRPGEPRTAPWVIILEGRPLDRRRHAGGDRFPDRRRALGGGSWSSSGIAPSIDMRGSGRRSYTQLRVGPSLGGARAEPAARTICSVTPPISCRSSGSSTTWTDGQSVFFLEECVRTLAETGTPRRWSRLVRDRIGVGPGAPRFRRRSRTAWPGASIGCPHDGPATVLPVRGGDRHGIHRCGPGLGSPPSRTEPWDGSLQALEGRRVRLPGGGIRRAGPHLQARA